MTHSRAGQPGCLFYDDQRNLPAELFTNCKKYRHMVCPVFISEQGLCSNNISLFRYFLKKTGFSRFLA
ncbi:MAG: hypothetical protein BWK80_10125 [Desulfobacteraceae bacterium IS3]|nr:MAG: hypothetical protein BWK80_10125 [Desulfobacteraceae bacterium IS3]